jgi:radical SAM protein with 4Fe4S-binding SPASM domain
MSEVSEQRYFAAPVNWLRPAEKFLAVNRLRAGWAVLNESAASIVRACESDAGSTLGDIQAAFQSRYGAVELAELTAWVECLVQAGLLQGSARAARSPERVPAYDSYRVEHVYIELLARCNLRCVHCFMGGAPERKELLAPDEVLALLDDFAARGGQYVTLSGGEPLLYRRFADVAHHVADLGLYGTVITNGTVLRAEQLELLDRLGFNVAISLDGITPEVNAAIRGRSPAKPIDAVDRTLQRIGPDRFILSFTPVKANIAELPKLFEFIEAKGIRRLNLSLYEAVGRAVDYTDVLTLGAADRMSLIDAVYRQAIAWAGRVEIDFNDTRNILSQFSAERTATELHPLWRGVRVTSSGDVYPSSFGAVERFRLGNIREIPFRRLLDSQVLADLYAALLDRDAKTPKCRECAWRQICRGGSVASAFCASGQIYAPDAYCDAYLEVFPNVALALADMAPARAT